MKSSDIQLGSVYTAKVGGKQQEVRIERKLPRNGWEATSLATNKTVRIKTPQQLIEPVGAAEPTQASQDAIGAPAVEALPESSQGDGEPSEATQTPAPPAKGRRSKALAKANPAPAAVETKLSCLDAAARVLKEKGESLSCRQMVDAMFAAKLWHSDAPTPAATLSSAILREMNTRKDASRFRKTGRGLFAFSGK